MAWEVNPFKYHTYGSVVYCVYAIMMVLVSTYRRALSNEDFFSDGFGRYIRTGGRIVVMTTILSLGLYIILIGQLLSIP
jgi:hypothetical protein